MNEKPPYATPPAGPDEFLTRKDLASRMKISVTTVDRWREIGAVSYFKVGKVVLFSWREVKSALERFRCYDSAPRLSPNSTISPDGKPSAGGKPKQTKPKKDQYHDAPHC